MSGQVERATKREHLRALNSHQIGEAVGSWSLGTRAIQARETGVPAHVRLMTVERLTGNDG